MKKANLIGLNFDYFDSEQMKNICLNSFLSLVNRFFTNSVIFNLQNIKYPIYFIIPI